MAPLKWRVFWFFLPNERRVKSYILLGAALPSAQLAEVFKRLEAFLHHDVASSVDVLDEPNPVSIVLHLVEVALLLLLTGRSIWNSSADLAGQWPVF